MAFHGLWVEAQLLMWAWEEWKLFLERSIAFSSDALHVLIGVFILFAAALGMRRPVSNWRPWFVTLCFISLNEFTDLQFERWPRRSMQYGESARDLILTMALPTVLLLGARFLPQLFASSLPRKA